MRLLALTTFALTAFTLMAAACSSGPSVSPTQCQDICTAAKAPGVCWYSDDSHGSGTCVCKDDDGNCPFLPSSPNDSGVPVTPGLP